MSEKLPYQDFLARRDELQRRKQAMLDQKLEFAEKLETLPTEIALLVWDAFQLGEKAAKVDTDNHWFRGMLRSSQPSEVMLNIWNNKDQVAFEDREKGQENP